MKENLYSLCVRVLQRQRNVLGRSEDQVFGVVAALLRRGEQRIVRSQLVESAPAQQFLFVQAGHQFVDDGLQCGVTST